MAIALAAGLGLFWVRLRTHRRPLMPEAVKAAASAPIAPTRRTVREAPGPLSARQAWELVQPVLRNLDPAPRLTLLTSGLDLNSAGLSFTWEFGFELPATGQYALLGIVPSGEGPSIDTDALVLEQRLQPLRRMPAVARPVLPTDFTDSPEAVAEFTRQGIDFVSGRSEMSLSARVLPSGEAVWVTEDWHAERTVPFVARQK